jgi:hypothetical protein
MADEKSKKQNDAIKLSDYAQALVDSVEAIKPREQPDDYTKLTVSRAMSFLAIAYERVRNAIEYREDHLIRRAAIERILRRRLSINPNAEGEAENLLRELLWARYFPKNSLGEDDVDTVQKILEAYVDFRDKLLKGKSDAAREYLGNFLMDLLTCEIEETLSPDTSAREAMYTYFLYQTMHKTVRVDGINDQQKDMFFLIALEKAYRKSDQSYQRFHTYGLFYKTIPNLSEKHKEQLIPILPKTFQSIDATVRNPNVEKMIRYIKKQLPAYLILYDLMNDNKGKMENVLTSKTALWQEVEKKCIEKYKQVKSRLTGLAIRSLIYIFATKMILAIILEYPVSMLLYNEAPIMPIVINSLFPPILMIIIVLWFKLPGKDNTVRIYHRIIQVLDSDPSFETRVALITKKVKEKTRFLNSIFSFFYIVTFGITLYVIHSVLNMLDFHLLSQALFIFFISVVSFFAYRIKQIINEYRILEKDSALAPIIDFFFVPILSLGKMFNKGVAKINIFTVIFDFFIEAPFKLIIDIVEEWIKFTKDRKEEII